MNDFSYAQANTAEDAINFLTEKAQSIYIAGGTTLLDMMKANLTEPPRLVDINRLPFTGVEQIKDGLRIGAMERMNAVGEHPLVKELLPAVSESLLLAASPQLRNMASIGGNILQRTPAVTSGMRPEVFMFCRTVR